MKSKKVKFDSPNRPLKISELPLDQQLPLLVWADHSTTVFFMYEDEQSMMAWDYELWYDYWIRDEEAPIE